MSGKGQSGLYALSREAAWADDGIRRAANGVRPSLGVLKESGDARWHTGIGESPPGMLHLLELWTDPRTALDRRDPNQSCGLHAALGGVGARAAATQPRVARCGARVRVFGMALTLDQIVEETRSLPHDVVSELVDRILLAAHGGQSGANEKAWSETVHRRIEEIRGGHAQLVPGEEVSAKIRRIVGR